MIVYLFRFDRDCETSEEFNSLYSFLLNLKKDNCLTNYNPSKKALSLGVDTFIYTELCEWVKLNIKSKFEFEEHSVEERCLVQFNAFKEGSMSVQYLLPLFSPESYLIT